ncbi:hypothetical protein LWP59_21425 [Amycolatopsis acidiphila]|uniref:DUF4383 domain-containing protein n=1 Tax=Amycolatopsis acidiphila TaxID=715473 RepID=A0A557ZUI6_9PSEU|nr:hypothetical protein [Amycolatopsis acidiphila]TVT15683.1 hypothetical protein FNH06_35820 [Amycolatopsis acidiphila]UIJ63921.1 hypothetical protein LWP59_21425 [Amycolatopsis acidiphila]GHG55413.1 hypothetical protein GCM10017788_05970 [Amycolatopsis acidiphila]
MVAWVLRVLVILGLLGSAWVHYDLYANEGFSDIPTIGPLFLVNVVAGVAIAVAVAVWHHWLPVLAAVGFGAVTLGAYLISLTPGGLMGVHEEFVMASEVWGVVTEAGCVVFGIALIFAQARTGARAVARV